MSDQQFAALQLYEVASLERRDVIRKSILPGRDHPANPLTSSSPAAWPSDSSILPTDSVALELPNLTLGTVSSTGIVGGRTTLERKEQRELDNAYCAAHFRGHVVLSSLNTVLRNLGSQALVEKLATLKTVASNGVSDNLRVAILEKYHTESLSSSTLADRMIQNRYWLSKLADAASQPEDPSPLALDFFPTPAELPKQHGYRKRRKYDASLRACAAATSNIYNIFVNVEYTQTDAPTTKTNPLIGASASIAKYQQAVTNADNLLTFQSTRLYIPTLSFHGKKEQTTLFFSIINQERFEFAVIENCFSRNLVTVSALLHLLRTVSIYELGCNPLFTYTLTVPPTGFSVGDIRPDMVLLPGFPAPIHLTGKLLSPLRTSPFQRSTVVLSAELHKSGKSPVPLVVKVSFIAEQRLWREKVVVDALFAGDLSASPAYAPNIIAAFAARGSPAPTDSSTVLGTHNQPAGASMVRRHLELMALTSPPDACKLADHNLTANSVFTAARQLFLAVLDAFRRGVIHRDLSVNNILFAQDHLLLVDWEIGRRFIEAVTEEHTVTGTLDTMSIASLMMETPLPHDDLESAAYVLLKVLTQRFKPRDDLQARWNIVLRSFYWDDSTVTPYAVQQCRLGLWNVGKTGRLANRASTIGSTLEIFQKSGYIFTAQFIHSLFSLPLPHEREEEEATNHVVVLSSLRDLVERAVAAVDSADVSKITLEIG
ncbi:hypothetical protein C8R47DRAFT_1156243 [Mycena vitilis]|nr:hypothetical protein C8R47DRAFT_1156243 [Mycena vitilis]